MIFHLLFSLLTTIYSHCDPYGLRLSLGYYYSDSKYDDHIIHINFNTLDLCDDLHIQSDEFGKLASNSVHKIDLGEIYKDFEPTKHFQHKANYTYITYVHSFQIGSLQSNRIYHYTIIGDQQYGSYQFKVPDKMVLNNEKQKILFFGDIDSQWKLNRSSNTFDYLQNLQQNETDIIIINGDLAYDLESDNGQRGDNFLRNMSTFSEKWPIMITPGNHDSGNNTQFSLFRSLFFSPDSNFLNSKSTFTNFYSFNLGLVHYISFNPYYLIYFIENKEYEDSFNRLMKNDLSQVNRNITPWIVVYSHYPLYCSDIHDFQYSFIDLFTEYQVDLYVAAHQHYYERDLPYLYNKPALRNIKANHTMKEYTEPIHILVGATGNDDSYDKELKFQKQNYTEFLSTEYSIGQLTIHNDTCLEFQQISTVTSKLIDYVYITKPSREDIVHTYHQKWFWIYLGIGTAVVGLIIAFAFLIRFYLDQREKQQLQKYTQSNIELQQKDEE